MTWKKIIKDTKIINLRFHDTRHEAVSRLVEAGLGDQKVAAIYGCQVGQKHSPDSENTMRDLNYQLKQLCNPADARLWSSFIGQNGPCGATGER